MPRYQVAVTEMWTNQWLYDVDAESEEEAQTIGHQMWEDQTNSMSNDQLRDYLEFADSDVEVVLAEGEEDDDSDEDEEEYDE
jgi:hypothetical protein